MTLAAFFVILLVGLCASIFFVWPPPAESPWLEVTPPVATVAPGASQMFDTKIWHTRDQGVTWSATGGLITPNGLFTASSLKAGDRVVLTAARSTDHTLTGTALVIIEPTGLAISPTTASLLDGMPQQFTAMEAHPASGSQTASSGATTATASGTQAPKSGAAPSPPAPPPGPAPAPKLGWSISDPDAAKITQDGLITSLKPITQFRRLIVTVKDNDPKNPERQAAAVLYLNPGNMQANAATPAAELSRDRVLIELVMLMGALGALLAASRSLASFVGNKTFVPRWSLYYVLRPLFGAGLAAIVFFGYRIGAVTGLKDTAPADPFAAAFVAGMVGLFADTVLQKLKDTIDALLPSKDDRGDKIAPDTTAPSITSAQGSVTSKQMTIKGDGFVQGATVTLNGQARDVTFVDANTLRVTLKDSDTGKVSIVVTNLDKQASAAFDGEITA
jgi:IPT/TIG domain